MELLFWIAVIAYIFFSVLAGQSQRQRRRASRPKRGPGEVSPRPPVVRPWDPLGGPFGPSGPFGEPWPPLPEPSEGPYAEEAEPEVEPVSGPAATPLPAEPRVEPPPLPVAVGPAPGPAASLPPMVATGSAAPKKPDRRRELLAAGPLDRESVVLGIIFEEILRPPRCRRPWRPIYRGED
ncbi:MAG: hypothetical protein H5U02_07580 [Clostridia bacterium]|nr:hypothetical protein [Clostridia bacterium]